MKLNRVAIVYDWLDSWGGVERVLLVLKEMFPGAAFFSSYFDEKKAAWAKGLYPHTSFIQQLPGFIRNRRFLSMPFYPYAFESFDFSGYDLVISVTSSFAKGIITKPETFHLCYLLTPPRFLWVDPEKYGNPTAKKILKPYIRKLSQWDKVAAMRPDMIISISKAVAERCRKHYHRTSPVVYPPFSSSYWRELARRSSTQKREYYLVVGRLEPYKRVDLAISAFAKLPGEKLVIVGNGTQSAALRRNSPANVTFIPSATDRELAGYYSRAKALIMPQEEDFGYVSLEAQALGCPVIAYGRGGALETVVKNKTGIFFHDQTAESIIEAIGKFDIISHTLHHAMPDVVTEHMEAFSRKRFEKGIVSFIQSDIHAAKSVSNL